MQFRTIDLPLTKRPFRHWFQGNWWHLRTAGNAIECRFGADGTPSEMDQGTVLHDVYGRDIGWVWLSLKDDDDENARTVSIQHGMGSYGNVPVPVMPGEDGLPAAPDDGSYILTSVNGVRKWVAFPVPGG